MSNRPPRPEDDHANFLKHLPSADDLADSRKRHGLGRKLAAATGADENKLTIRKALPLGCIVDAEITAHKAQRKIDRKLHNMKDHLKQVFCVVSVGWLYRCRQAYLIVICDDWKHIHEHGYGCRLGLAGDQDEGASDKPSWDDPNGIEYVSVSTIIGWQREFEISKDREYDEASGRNHPVKVTLHFNDDAEHLKPEEERNFRKWLSGHASHKNRAAAMQQLYSEYQKVSAKSVAE